MKFSIGVLRSVPAGLALSLTLFSPGAAQAGPVEEVASVAFHPTDPNVMVLRYEYAGGGLLYSDDAGTTFRLLCGSAISATDLKGSGSIAIAGDGATVVGESGGFWEGDAQGCGSQPVAGYEGLWINDVIPNPTDPDVTYATSSENAADVWKGILRRDASGAWSELSSTDDVLPMRLRIVETTTGIRMYTQCLTGLAAGTYDQLIRVSDDEGATWEDFPVQESGALGLQAVDPSNPDRVVATVRGDTTQSVMVSNDRGATFSEYMQVNELGGVAFAPDGRVFIGDRKPGPNGEPPGVWQAPNLDASPTRLNDKSIRCLAFKNETLYACSTWMFGTVDLTDGTFDALHDFRTVPELVSCDGVDMTAACEEHLCAGLCGPGHFAEAPVCCAYDSETCGPSFATNVDAVTCEGFQAPPDSPGSDGGTVGSGGSGTTGDGGTPPPSDPPDDGGCSCRTARSTHSSSWLSLLGAGALAALLRVRRRRAR